MNTPSTQDDARVDELLAIRCQLGERPAFDELITRWHEPLWRYIRRLASDAAAASDITQETWIRVVRGIVRLREPARLRAWLFGIARRAAMDALREKYSRPAHTDVAMEHLPATEDSVNLDEELATLEHELARLPIVEREALTLFYLRELSLAQIAEVLGVPEGTVKSRLHRARHLLRRAIQNKGVSS